MTKCFSLSNSFFVYVVSKFNNKYFFFKIINSLFNKVISKLKENRKTMIKRKKRTIKKFKHSLVKNNESVNLSNKKQKEIINYILDASKPKLIPVIPLITLNEIKRNKNQGKYYVLFII